MLMTLLFILLAGLATGCAISLVTQRNPLYCAISLIGVFVSLAGLYVTLAAPFIAAVQIIVYAGAIMVLVVFVIMLLNVEEEERRPTRKRILIPIAVILAAVLFGEAAFVIYFVGGPRAEVSSPVASNIGLTHSVGSGLFTQYLLPFEITSVLLLMAIVGAMTLARRAMPRRRISAVTGSDDPASENAYIRSESADSYFKDSSSDLTHNSLGSDQALETHRGD